MLGPSLLEGNTAVFKPSEDAPAVGRSRLAELFVEAGFPAGVINLVHGCMKWAKPLVRDRAVNVVLFTGSYDVGRAHPGNLRVFYDRITAWARWRSKAP